MLLLLSLLLLLPAVAGGKQHGMATICVQTVAKHDRAANRVQAISKPAGASMLALPPQNDVFRPLSSSSVTVPGIRQKSYMSYQNQPVMDRTEATADVKTKICSCIAWPTQECRMLLRTQLHRNVPLGLRLRHGRCSCLCRSARRTARQGTAQDTLR